MHDPEKQDEQLTFPVTSNPKPNKTLVRTDQSGGQMCSTIFRMMLQSFFLCSTTVTSGSFGFSEGVDSTCCCFAGGFEAEGVTGFWSGCGAKCWYVLRFHRKRSKDLFAVGGWTWQMEYARKFVCGILIFRTLWEKAETVEFRIDDQHDDGRSEHI